MNVFYILNRIKEKIISYRKLLYVMAICTVILLASAIIYRINNKVLYALEAEIKSEFHEADGIDVWDYGPYCTVVVYVDKDCSYEDIEPIFISIMLKLDDKDNFKYFKERHSRDASGELAFLQVSFYEENAEDNLLFEFTSQKDFETWKLATWRLGIKETVIYNVSDYK